MNENIGIASLLNRIIITFVISINIVVGCNPKKEIYSRKSEMSEEKHKEHGDDNFNKLIVGVWKSPADLEDITVSEFGGTYESILRISEDNKISLELYMEYKLVYQAVGDCIIFHNSKSSANTGMLMSSLPSDSDEPSDPRRYEGRVTINNNYMTILVPNGEHKFVRLSSKQAAKYDDVIRKMKDSGEYKQVEFHDHIKK